MLRVAITHARAVVVELISFLGLVTCREGALLGRPATLSGSMRLAWQGGRCGSRTLGLARPRLGQPVPTVLCGSRLSAAGRNRSCALLLCGPPISLPPRAVGAMVQAAPRPFSRPTSAGPGLFGQARQSGAAEPLGLLQRRSAGRPQREEHEPSHPHSQSTRRVGTRFTSRAPEGAGP